MKQLRNKQYWNPTHQYYSLRTHSEIQSLQNSGTSNTRTKFTHVIPAPRTQKQGFKICLAYGTPVYITFP